LHLRPNTTYYYRIPPVNHIFHFQTAPIPSIDDPAKCEFEFVVVSDMHGSARRIGGTIRLIQNLLPNVRFILSGGDNVDDARIRGHWVTFWKQMEPVSPILPFESTPGNHDGEIPDAARNWQKVFPFPYPNPTDGSYFKFQFLNTAFFFIDIYNAGRALNVVNPAQLDWLREELIKDQEGILNRVIVLHRSLYTTGDFGCDNVLEGQLLPVITELPVKLVVAGHSHLFEAFFRSDLNPPAGTAFLNVGGGGGWLDLVSSKISAAPYRWKSRVHVAKQDPYLGGNPHNPLRNDQIVLKFQEYGKLCNHILHVIVRGDTFTLRAIEWGGEQIYEKTF
jgi:hypothetical protein